MLDTDKVLRNLSKTPLMKDEKMVLSLGLNYALTPRSIHTHSVIAATEAATRQLDTDTAEKLRGGVSNVIRSSRTPRSNLPNYLHRAAIGFHNDATLSFYLWTRATLR